MGDYNKLRVMISYERYDKVWLEYRQHLRWFLGEVTQVHSDGTYQVHTDDGKVEEHAVGAYMYLVHHGRSVTPGNHSKYVSLERAISMIEQEQTCAATENCTGRISG